MRNSRKQQHVDYCSEPRRLAALGQAAEAWSPCQQLAVPSVVKSRLCSEQWYRNTVLCLPHTHILLHTRCTCHKFWWFTDQRVLGFFYDKSWSSIKGADGDTPHSHTKTSPTGAPSYQTSRFLQQGNSNTQATQKTARYAPMSFTYGTRAHALKRLS